MKLMASHSRESRFGMEWRWTATLQYIMQLPMKINVTELANNDTKKLKNIFSQWNTLPVAPNAD